MLIGAAPLLVGAVYVALRGSGAATTQPATDEELDDSGVRNALAVLTRRSA